MVSDLSTITTAIIGLALTYLHTQTKDKIFSAIYLFSALAIFIVTFYVTDATISLIVTSLGAVLLCVILVYGYRVLAELIGF